MIPNDKTSDCDGNWRVTHAPAPTPRRPTATLATVYIPHPTDRLALPRTLVTIGQSTGDPRAVHAGDVLLARTPAELVRGVVVLAQDGAPVLELDDELTGPAWARVQRPGAAL